MVVECYASVAAVDTHIDRMLSVSQQPTAFSNCQHGQHDTLTLCLTSIDSFNAAVGHTSICRTHTHTCSAVGTQWDTHTSCYTPWHCTSTQPGCVERGWKGETGQKYRCGWSSWPLKEKEWDRERKKGNMQGQCTCASKYLCLQSEMIDPVFCCKVSTEREAYLSKMRDRVWSWHRHNSSILPLKREKDEEKDGGVWEDTAISGLDNGERKEERREKRKAWFAIIYLSASFLYWTESEDWAHHWLSLSSLLFFPSPGWLEGPVIHSYPRSFLGSSSTQCFLLLRQLAHNIHLFI